LDNFPMQEEQWEKEEGMETTLLKKKFNTGFSGN
jgi:hypothetical protein